MINNFSKKVMTRLSKEKAKARAIRAIKCIRHWKANATTKITGMNDWLSNRDLAHWHIYQLVEQNVHIPLGFSRIKLLVKICHATKMPYSQMNFYLQVVRVEITLGLQQGDINAKALYRLNEIAAAAEWAPILRIAKSFLWTNDERIYPATIDRAFEVFKRRSQFRHK